MSSSSSSPQPLNTPAKQWLKHIGAYLVLMLIAALYFKPNAFDGKVFQQHDNVQAVAMQKEIYEYKNNYDREIYWTNQYFGGMPTALMRSSNINHVDSKLVSGMFLYQNGGSWMLLFMIMLSCYIGLSLMGVNLGFSIALSATLALFTANILYIQAGHSGKMLVVSTVPALIGAFVYAYKKNWLLGSAIFATVLSFNLSKNHVQMTYYTFFALGIIGLAFAVEAFKSGKVKQWSRFAGSIILATILGVVSNIGFLWPSYSYGQESTRGKTELTIKETKSGLDKNYVFSLSLEKAEIMALMFPNFYGGTQGKFFAQDRQSATAKVLGSRTFQQQLQAAAQQAGIKDQAEFGRFQQQFLGKYTTQYRGSQTMSGGPIYYGAVVCFLFILSLLLLRGAYKWGALLSFLLFVILAWGSHFAVFNDFMYHYFPLYAKFRDTKMTLLVAQPLVILTIGAGLMHLVKFDPNDYEGSLSAKLLPYLKQTVSRQGYVVLGTVIAAGLCVFMMLWINMGVLSSPRDAELMAFSPDLVSALQEDRAALAMKDIWCALGFVLATALVLFLYARDTFRVEIAAVALGILAMADLGTVNSDYLSDKSYQERKNYSEDINATPQDLQIQKDKTIYRVADYLRGAPSQNAQASAFHKSVGGYFAAKPLLYQELWEYYKLDQQMAGTQVHSNIMSMLNVKYYITREGVINGENPLGNAWLVEKVNVVPNADAELNALDDLDPFRQAVVQERYADYVKGLEDISYTPGDKIYLQSYDPDTMVYRAQTSGERFAVFSEMYYPPEKGWTVYINGEEVDPFVKTNYVLRGLRIPAGDNEIKMVFAPQSIILGRHIGGITSIVIILLLGVAIFFYYKQQQQAIDEQSPVV